MRKQAKYTYQKMNQDVSKSKHSENFYWEAKNVRVITNENFGSVENQKGNELVLTLPQIVSNPTTKSLTTIGFPINDLKIIHTEKIEEDVILFCTNQNADCIYKLSETSPNVFQADLLFIDDLGWSYSTQLESVGINESDESKKVYFVDGISSVRSINIADSTLINKSPEDLGNVPTVQQFDPEFVEYVSGGSHKAGVIQYSYNLYNKYGQQTVVSGTSELIALYNNDKGSPLDADISKSPKIKIDNIDQSFDYIKIYSIFYSSYQQTPKISLIYENINSNSTIELVDSNDIIREITLDEYNFISNQDIIPKHIDSKDGHLFFGNYKLEQYDVELDTRAYSFEKLDGLSGSTIWEATFEHSDGSYPDYHVWDTNNPINPRPAGSISYANFLAQVEDDHDVINNNPNAIHIYNSTTIGAEGPNVKITLYLDSVDLDDTLSDRSSLKGLKSGDSYRIGLNFYNSKDQKSFTHWCTDLRVPAINQDRYITYTDTTGTVRKYTKANVELKNKPADAKSWRVVRVERRESDRIVKCQGIVNPCIVELEGNVPSGTTVNFGLKKIMPSYFTRVFDTVDGDALIDVSAPSGNPSYMRDYKYKSPSKFNQDNDISFYGDSLIDNYTTETQVDKEIAFPDHLYTKIDLEPASENILSKPYYFLSRREFTFNSPDITFGGNNLSINKNTAKLRTLGFSKLQKTFSKVDLYTSYESEVTFKYNSPFVGDINLNGSFPKEEGIGIFYTFEFDSDTSAASALKDVIYLFQIDGDSGDIPSDPDIFKSTTADLASRNFISPLRTTFSTTINGVNIDLPRWEFKKSFILRRFEGYYKSENDYISNFNPLANPIFVPASNATDILLKNIDYVDSYNPVGGATTTDTTNTTFDPSMKIDTNTTFRSFVDSCLLFQSTDLYDNLVSTYGGVAEIAGANSASPIVEIYDNSTIQYGGNTYQARQRNVYIPFSKKYDINTSNALCEYGDTYIQRVPLIRIAENNSGLGNVEGTLSEIIYIDVETYINNDMRYDTVGEENGNATVSTENYGRNQVYEQANNFEKFITRPLNLSTQEEFVAEVIATPKKILGEIIDNWTSISVNDRITLDTKYGGITGMKKLKDTMFVFQKNAICYLAINPRVQIATNDSIPVQLGTGKLIERYDYISTKSGTVHPKSLISTESGLYYYDYLNYSLNRLTRNSEEISLTKGLYNYIKKFSIDNFSELVEDINDQGNFQANADFKNVIAYYDNESEDIYFTFRAGSGDDFTVAYNLLADGFTSFYDFVPNQYFRINNRMFSVPANNQVWEHDKGLNNTFFNVYYPSSIKLLVNPDPDEDKIFDTISFVQDTKLNDVDQYNITFNKIKVDTAYQTSGEVPLTYGKNIRRKFREYYIQLPRQQGTINRIRAPYAFIELIFDHEGSDYKFTLNDTKLDYTIN